MATETLYATSLTSAGGPATPANALGAPDGTFTTDVDNVSWTGRFAIGNPTGNQANGTHTIRLRVRKETGTGTPSIASVTLYEGSTSISTISTGAVNVTSTTGVDQDYTFASSLLSGRDLSNIEVEIATSGVGGAGGVRTCIQLDAVTWTGDFTSVTNANITATSIVTTVTIPLPTVVAQVSAAVTATTIAPTAVDIPAPTVNAGSGGGGALAVYMAVASLTLSTNDQHLSDILTTAGHTVTPALSTSNLPNSGYDVCVVTESGSSGSAANTSIPTCTLPVVHGETNWPTTRMSSATATQGGTATTAINVIDTTHPIVQGFSDPFTFSTSANTYGVASTTLPSGVVNVAEYDLNAGHVALAAADTGATLTSGTAPARRVEYGFGIGGSSVANWNANGDTLFVQAVEWAGGIGGGSNASVTAVTISSTVTIPTPSIVAENPNVFLTPPTISRTVSIPTPSVSSGVILPGLVDGVEPEAAGGWQGPHMDSNGNLYRVTEEYLGAGGAGFGNHPMMMKSSDGGQTWTRVDAANSPGYGVGGSYNDLESAWLVHRPTADEVVLCYMKAQSRWWGISFRTSDHPTNPDTWDTSTFATSSGQDQFGTTASESAISGVALSDGTVRAFIRGTPQGGFEAILHRTKATTTWDTGSTYITDTNTSIVRPSAVVGENDTTYLFYRDHTNGQVRYRTITSTGTVNASARVDSGGAGATDDYFNNVVPPVFYMDGSTPVAVVGFVNASNQLRTVEVRGGVVQSEQVVSTDTVTLNPLNSVGASTANQGPAAALAVHGTTLYALWGDNTSGDLYYATRANGGSWSARTLLADTGASKAVHWLYAKVNTKPNSNKVLSFTYDIGPHGDDEGEINYNELALASGTDATVSAITISRTVSIAGQTVSAGTGASVSPTTISRTVAIAGAAGISVTATPVTISRTVSIAGQTLVAGTGATVSPATISRTVAIAGATSISVTATPVTISRTVSIAGQTLVAGTGVSVSPTTITSTASMAGAASISVTVSPTTISRTVSIAGPAISAGGSATALPVTISGTVSIAGQGVSAGSGAAISPPTVFLTASIAGATVQAGGSASVSPATISRTVSFPGATRAAGQTVTVTTITSTVAMGVPTVLAPVSAQVLATTVASTVTIGVPSVFSGGGVTVPVITIGRTVVIGQPTVFAGGGAPSSAFVGWGIPI